MIRHCVFIRFREGTASADKAEFYHEIADLRGRLPGLLEVHEGRNVSPETGVDKGFSEGFIVDFDSPAARDLYLADPEHQETGAKIVAAAEGGLAGIFVYDMEIAAP